MKNQISFGVQMEMKELFSDMDHKSNQAFFEYHRKHPEVYKTFKRLTLETIAKGFTRFSARGIFQVMRWIHGGRKKEDGFKYNNNYTPYYSRMFERDYPKHAGFFEKRKVKEELK